MCMKNRTVDGFGSISEIVEKHLDKLDIRCTRGNYNYCKDEYVNETREITKLLSYESSVEQIVEAIKTVFRNQYDESSIIETAQSIHDAIVELKKLESFKKSLINKVRVMSRRGKKVAFFWKAPVNLFWDPNPTKYYLGTLSDSLVFTPQDEFYELSEEEREALEFPDNWDISAITDSGHHQH